MSRITFDVFDISRIIFDVFDMSRITFDVLDMSNNNNKYGLYTTYLRI